MPWSSPEKHRAYMAKYQKSPEQVRRRVARNKARREYERAHGDLPGDVDVDHVMPLDKGGGGGMSNLRAQPRGENRGYERDARNQPKKNTRDYGKGK